MTADPGLVRRTAEHLVALYPPVAQLAVRFDDCPLRIRSNDTAVIERLHSYFAPFVVDGVEGAADIVVLEGTCPDLAVSFRPRARSEPGKRIKEEYADVTDGRVVRKPLTGMHFLFGGGVHVAIGPCAANLNQIINYVNNRFIEWRMRRGARLLHAAGVADGRGGLGLCGFSGAGKSTLALHLMTTGMNFVSNDRLLVQRRATGMTMYGVPKWPRVNPGTLLHNPDLAGMLSAGERARLGQLPRSVLWDLEQKFDVIIETRYGPGRLQLSGPIVALVILNWRHGAEPLRCARVDVGQRPDLNPAFAKSAGVFYEAAESGVPPESTAQQYAELLDGLAVFEVTGGVDFAAAVGACQRILDVDA